MRVVQEAEKVIELGKEAFEKQDYQNAINYYNHAIEVRAGDDSSRTHAHAHTLTLTLTLQNVNSDADLRMLRAKAYMQIGLSGEAVGDILCVSHAMPLHTYIHTHTHTHTHARTHTHQARDKAPQ